MANYLTSQIIRGALDYTAVVTKFPQYKDAINAELTRRGRADLIVSDNIINIITENYQDIITENEENIIAE